MKKCQFDEIGVLRRNADSDDVAAWITALARVRGENVVLSVNKGRTEVKARVRRCTY